MIRNLPPFWTEPSRRYPPTLFAAALIPKRQIPKVYLQRYPPIRNLWKYNLSRSWRLMYTVASDGDTIAVIIEWLDHTGYDRRFGY